MASSTVDSPEHLPSSAARTSDESVHAIPKGKVESPNETPSMDHRSDEEETERSSKLGGYRLYAVAIGVLFGSLMMAIDISIIGTAIPSILSEFGNISQLAWYPAAYTFAICAVTPLAGKMAVVFPLNWVYLSFSGIFLIGSIVCGCAPTSNAFIAGRAVSGVGAAGVASNGMTILVTISDFRKKMLFVGLAAACFGIGLVLGPVLGGVFTERVTWRWCFWINIPFIAITVAVIFLFFKPLKSKSETMVARLRRLDLIGFAIFVPAIFMLLLALQRGGQVDPWKSATIIGLFVGSGLVMTVFVVWEWYKGDQAMIPRTAVMRRTVVFTCLFAFCHMGSLGLAPYYLPEWFQVVEGVDPLQSGVRMLPTVIAQILATMTASRLAFKLKYYNFWFILAPMFMVTSSALYTQFTAFSTPESHWIGFQVMQGIGGGFGMQMSSLAVQLELIDSPELVPVGIALVTFTQYLGSSVLQVIAGTIFNNVLVQQLTGHAGLTAEQTNLLIGGQIRQVREITAKNFPTLLNPILESYNSAITRIFFVPVAGTIVAFFLAFGIKWNKIPDTKKPEAESHTTEAEPDLEGKDLEGNRKD